jgi:PAS domain-containing protein
MVLFILAWCDRYRQALLRQSEERYRMLFEEATDGILIMDRTSRIAAEAPKSKN